MQEIDVVNFNGVVIESIQLVKAIFSESMTKKQLDLILYIVSLVQKDDEKFHTYVIPLSEVKKIICESNPRTEEVKNILKREVKALKKACFTIEDEYSTSWYGWIDFARIDWKKETLTIRLSDEVAKFYLQLNEHKLIFTLRNMLKLSTLTQARLYQWAYSKTGFPESSLSIDDAIKIFYGIKPIRNIDFLRKHLEPAIKAINERTDIEIEYEKIKADTSNKRKITSLKFKVKSKYQKQKKPRKASQIESDRKKSREMWKENEKLKTENERLKTANENLTEKNDLYRSKLAKRLKEEEELERKIEEM